MLRTITPAEMKRVEARAMAETGVSGETLMAHAAAHAARAARRLCQSRPGEALCLCGNGNNGGDGLAAMFLLGKGECWLLPGPLSADCQRELIRLQERRPQVVVRVLSPEEPLPPPPAETACVVDALFGTGLSRPLSGLAAKLCALSNALKASGVPVLAVDIPSGLDGTTGQALGESIRATETVTFHRPKPGLYLANGMDHAGRVTVCDIGVPAAQDDAPGLSVLEKDDLSRLLPPREHLSHKGSYGRALLFAGSVGMAGAAAICAAAALRAGAGLVTVACPEEIVPVVQTLCPCATCLPLAKDADEAWEGLRPALCKADAVAAGCGLGRSEWAARLLRKLLDSLGKQPLALDADGLNLLSQEDFPPLPAHTVLTPHPAEAARLWRTDVGSVLLDPIQAARSLQARFHASVVLKGAASVLVAGDDVGLNVLGTPALAKGGSGDALTGVLVALLAGRAAGAYSMTDLELLQAATALHGLAGLRAEKSRGRRGVLATDVCDFLGLDA